MGRERATALHVPVLRLDGPLLGRDPPLACCLRWTACVFSKSAPTLREDVILRIRHQLAQIDRSIGRAPAAALGAEGREPKDDNGDRVAKGQTPTAEAGSPGRVGAVCGTPL